MKRVIIIGCGIAGPTLAMALQKCGIKSTIYDSQKSPADNRGLFLYLGPNGVNILRTLEIEDKIRESGYRCTKAVFEKHNGDTFAQLDEADFEKNFGADSIVIKRARLQKIMRNQAESRGIKMEWGKKLEKIATDDNMVTVQFTDGTSVSGDCIVGCDGLHSRTRKIMMPDSPAPKYSGYVTAGAITPNQTKQPQNELTFHFGKKAYMIYFVNSDNETMWAAHLQVKPDSLYELKDISSETWQRTVYDMFDKDASYTRDFIKNENNLTKIPLYDIEFLPTWHKGLVCLVGDSAHATTPHAGQGASMAMESALTLAKCLRDIPDIRKAFAKYQYLRKERVEKMISIARRNGGMFTTTNPAGKWFRNTMMSAMMKRWSTKMDDVYGYKVDWDEKIKP